MGRGPISVLRKNYIKILFFGLIVSLLPIKLSIAQEPPAASDFKLQDINQDIISLSSYKDKQPIVLLFWTTWSPFCEKELSVLNNMYADLTKEGIEVLSINSGESFDKVEDFIKNHNLAYRVLLDKDAGVSGLFKILGFPTYVLIDKKGDMVFKNNYFPFTEYKDLILK